MNEKRVMVIGASMNPDRYANRAIKLLRHFDYEVEAVGIREGKVADVDIKKNYDNISGIHTVTIYLSPENQLPYYNFISELKPKRVIFNPGTENDDFKKNLENKGIEVIENCTLVMLNYNMF